MALPAQNRLRRSAEFKHVLNSASRARPGGRSGDRLLMISAVPTKGSGVRIGLSVSKRVGGSVTRNRVKRRLREIFRDLVVDREAGWDVVVSARPAAAEATYDELWQSASRLIARVMARR